jgi:outer membrane protein assembly factor BamD (BamD/ComL family)
MKKKLIFTFVLTVLSTLTFSVKSYSAIPTQKVLPTSEAKTEIEKLTGRVALTKTALKPADKALMMARESRDQKNYVLAIKRYNYIIKNFAKTPQAAKALKDKSAIYTKMGFSKPAEYNLKKAKMLAVVPQKAGSVKK